MICLDTNYLIRGLSQGSTEEGQLIGWIKSGEILVTPMPAWFEFLCGPVTEEQKVTMRAFLARIIPFAEAEATEGARLFNAVHRKRALRVDAMIAGTAIAAKARFATNNRTDFKVFVAHGLELL
jgi:predicted nucleic acid-binding protein